MHQQITIKAFSAHGFDQQNHKKPIRSTLAQTLSKEQRESLPGRFQSGDSDFPLFK